jgi:hypothetical protein
MSDRNLVAVRKSSVRLAGLNYVVVATRTCRATWPNHKGSAFSWKGAVAHLDSFRQGHPSLSIVCIAFAMYIVMHEHVFGSTVVKSSSGLRSDFGGQGMAIGR